MSRYRKILTQEEIDAILFNDTDESDIDLEEDDGWGDDSMVVNDECNVDNSVIETDNDINDCLPVNDDVNWSGNVYNETIKFPRFECNAGPVHNLSVGSNPLQFLRLFLTADIMHSVCINTNKYAEFCARKRGFEDKDWYPIENIGELWAFFAVLLIMSINHIPRISDYWSTNPILGNEMVKRIMSRNRFKKIKHYFHLSDKGEEKNRDDENFTYTQKLEPFMTAIKEKCIEHFIPYEAISVDEAMVKFKGRLGIVQYMPLKPDKRGLKLWMMCTSHLGYTLNFDLYSGKKGKMDRSNKGLGYDVVFHLIKSLKNKGHNIYFDRFFTSVDLMMDLYKKGLGACGTVMVNRKKLPIEMKTLKLTNDYESKSFQCTEIPNLLCTAWLDKKQITMLSTIAKNSICEVFRRKGAEKHLVPCPSSFAKYNKNMGGVDLADQRRKYFTLARKSSKWWMYLFSFIFDTAVNNAYIIYQTSNYPLPKQTVQLLDFKLRIIEELGNEINSQKKKRAFVNVENAPFHQHKRQKINGRKRTCVSCRKNGKKTFSGGQVESSWECGICKTCLCKMCFE